ncbi:hypothetical protein SEPCBS57363_000946 [Sporothrix epigloea]|uniref:Uncharacterized protein n=1 Tax=Sporothrix epigloea TaxID=1892477 RepID=A0ABP0D7K0_9PEZI
MPRPPRRTRAAPSRTTAAATAATKERNELALGKTGDKHAMVFSIEIPSMPLDDANTSTNGRRRSSRRSSASIQQIPTGPSSDVHGAGDRETKRRTSLRQSAASATSATTAPTLLATSTAADPPRLSAHGPDASGLDMDDTFADIDAQFGDHDDLGDLDDDLDAFDGLDSSPPAIGASGSANAAHTADSTSSSFNVGLFRRGRPRQSSIHSRDDAPIRPSSRSGAVVTPSFGSTLNLGTFKRRAREPSILGRRRDPSRHTSRDRNGETSGSEMDNGPYTSEAESLFKAGRMRRGRQSSRAVQASHAAQSVADSLMASSSNTTSMLLMARTRNRAVTSRKRKSEEGQLEDDLPKRRIVDDPEEAPLAAVAATLAEDSVPQSDSEVMPSVEMTSSSPLSTPLRQGSLPMSGADRRRYATPGGPDDEVMAPPMSSGSSSASPTVWPSLKGLINAGRRARAMPAIPLISLSLQNPGLMSDDGSDISSPPSLTHSPNYRSRAPSKAKGKAPSTHRNAVPTENIAPLTSAALAALLPQRHRRGRSNRGNLNGADDVSGEGSEEDDELERSALLSEDDDELAHGPRRGGLRRGRSAARAPVLTGSRQNAQSLSAGKTLTVNLGKAGKAGKSARPIRRLYGSRSFSDKENQDAEDSTFAPQAGDAIGDDDTTAQVVPVPKARAFGVELDNAAQKFKEVDRWTLDYEVVSRSSSPLGAR